MVPNRPGFSGRPGWVDRFWLSLDPTVSPPDLADQPFYMARLIANPLPDKPPVSQNPGVPCDKPIY
jgi:hypothetical protein